MGTCNASRSVLSRSAKLSLFESIHALPMHAKEWRADAVAVAWFDRKGKLLELQHALNSNLNLTDRSEGRCLARIIKRRYELDSKEVVLVSYADVPVDQGWFHSHIQHLVPPLEVVGVSVLDILYVANGKDIGSPLGKLAPALK